MKRTKKQGLLLYNYVSFRVMLSILTYFIIVCVGNSMVVARGMSNSLFDYIVNLRGGGSASEGLMLFGILPILSLGLPLLMDRMENEMIVTRLQNKRALLYEQLLFSISISVIFTGLIVVVGIVVAYIENGHLKNLWGTKEGMVYFLLNNKSYFSAYIPYVTSGKIWVFMIFSRFLFILFMAICIVFFKLMLKKNVYVFFVSLILFVSDGYLIKDTSIFVGKINLSIETLIRPNIHFLNFGYFIVWIVLLFLISLKQYDKKEFYR